MNRTFAESLRFPAVDQAGAHHRQEARREERLPRDLDVHDRSGRQVHRARAHDARRRRRSSSIHEAGDPTQKLDLLILGDGYTPRERGKFERDARRLDGRASSRPSPFKERKARHQRVGPRAAGGAVRHLAAVAGHPPALAGRRDLRRVRLGALHPDVREPRVPRHRVQRAVRRRRDPDEHARPTAAAASSACTARSPPTARGRRTSSSTSSATTSPASPTSTTRRTWPTCRRPIASSPGSPT